MNKQELIDYCNAIKENKNQFINCIDVNRIIKRIEQLDEPQKVVVPQFVADWYEEHKKDLGYSIWNYIYYWDQQEGYDFKDWFDYGCCGTIQTLFNMHQFGYEVEKEKRYTVKIKGEIEENLLVYGLGIKRYFFARSYDSSKRNEHTRKQLEEAGFGEVFDSTLFEVEEVEE